MHQDHSKMKTFIFQLQFENSHSSPQTFCAKELQHWAINFPVLTKWNLNLIIDHENCDRFSDSAMHILIKIYTPLKKSMPKTQCENLKVLTLWLEMRPGTVCLSCYSIQAYQYGILSFPTCRAKTTNRLKATNVNGKTKNNKE